MLSRDTDVRRSVRQRNSWEKKMLTDEITREVWQAKDRLAREFNYDVDALVAELRSRQKQADRKIVDLAGEPAKQTAARPE